MLAQARAELPNECCGMLAGKHADDGATARVVQILPLVNAAASPVEFLSEERSLFQVEKARRAAGLEYLAVYHSHPTSPPRPSRKDLERNYSTNVVNFIISLMDAEPKVEGWWLTAVDFRPAEWEIVD